MVNVGRIQGGSSRVFDVRLVGTAQAISQKLGISLERLDSLSRHNAGQGLDGLNAQAGDGIRVTGVHRVNWLTQVDGMTHEHMEPVLDSLKGLSINRSL